MHPEIWECKEYSVVFDDDRCILLSVNGDNESDRKTLANDDDLKRMCESWALLKMKPMCCNFVLFLKWWKRRGLGAMRYWPSSPFKEQ